MNRILSSAPFTNLFWARSNPDIYPDSACDLRGMLTVNAFVPPSQRLVLVGQSASTGEWNPVQGVNMKCAKLPLWWVDLADIDLQVGQQYKYVIMNGNDVVQWEEGENRVWNLPAPNGSPHSDGEFRGANGYHPKFAGVAIPLFSIRSCGCEGIGDYISLGDFAAWAASTGQRVVQILPINDTTATHTRDDSYPYSSISIFALHPLYIRVSEFFDVGDAFAGLETLPEVDYDGVDEIKWRLFGEAYAEQGEQCLKSEQFISFFNRNKSWLCPYAVFSHLRDRFGTADFTVWGAPYNIYSVQTENRVIAENQYEVGFYYFLQFHADRQLHFASQKAHSVGVALKGDIPIGISRHSVEAWSEPHLFNMSGQAGAPPDDFALDGQNWGFPTYNWPAMAADGYAWWKARFAKMADYFDLYRIDHILGFFRIWEIPMPEKSGLMGHFSPSLPFSAKELSDWGLPMESHRYLGLDDSDKNRLFVCDHSDHSRYHPRIAAHSTDCYINALDDHQKERFDAIYNHYFYHRHNDFWARGAMEKLPPLIDATNMLCCAEDLGMIPACVGATLDQLQIITLEIQRMPKQYGLLFGNPACYPYLSVCTTSTHDISPIRLWWEDDRELIQRYYNDFLGMGGDAPKQASAAICEHIVLQHLRSPSIAAIFPLADWLSVDDSLRAADPASERINNPSDPCHYWRYRMHLSVDDLAAAAAFNAKLRALTAATAR